VERVKEAWSTARWVLVGFLLYPTLSFVIGIVRGEPGSHNVPFEWWYGDWGQVLIVSGIFLAFLLGFARPRRRAEWRSAGLYSAFLISLFAEMFGVPLTIYLLAPLLGLPVWAFGMNESHLWAFALDRLGLVSLDRGVYLVMAVSVVVIAAGLTLLAVGWATVYRGHGRLVTKGVYRYLRHPQYAGLILIVIGFNIMWPTLPTIVMAPILVVMYTRLARREDQELATFFGERFLQYAASTPAFLPGARPRTYLEIGQRKAENAPVSDESGQGIRAP